MLFSISEYLDFSDEEVLREFKRGNFEFVSVERVGEFSRKLSRPA